WCLNDRLPGHADMEERYASWLAPKEHERWQRFRFAADRDRYLLARALVRGTLSRYRPNTSQAQWVFDVNPQGRPTITPQLQGEGAALHFNLSHTKGLIVMGVSTSSQLGVDTEPVDRAGNHLSIAEHFFAASEARVLRKLPDRSAQQRRFFELWTLKEAYIKARGLGLALPLGSFAFSFPGSDGLAFRTWPEAGDSAVGWGFVLMTYGETHRVSLALREGPAPSPVTVRAAEVVAGEWLEVAAPLQVDRCTLPQAKILPLKP
ncbi:MAG: 4'-phosphopantetheinyl transferase superfamily protein, partial [Pseudomonadota bacterium]